MVPESEVFDAHRALKSLVLMGPCSAVWFLERTLKSLVLTGLCIL
jgi:hypothetical protein